MFNQNVDYLIHFLVFAARVAQARLSWLLISADGADVDHSLLTPEIEDLNTTKCDKRRSSVFFSKMDRILFIFVSDIYILNYGLNRLTQEIEV